MLHYSTKRACCLKTIAISNIQNSGRYKCFDGTMLCADTQISTVHRRSSSFEMRFRNIVCNYLDATHDATPESQIVFEQPSYERKHAPGLASLLLLFTYVTACAPPLMFFACRTLATCSTCVYTIT